MRERPPKQARAARRPNPKGGDPFTCRYPSPRAELQGWGGAPPFGNNRGQASQSWGGIGGSDPPLAGNGGQPS